MLCKDEETKMVEIDSEVIVENSNIGTTKEYLKRSGYKSVFFDHFDDFPVDLILHVDA